MVCILLLQYYGAQKTEQKTAYLYISTAPLQNLPNAEKCQLFTCQKLNNNSTPECIKMLFISIQTSYPLRSIDNRLHTKRFFLANTTSVSTSFTCVCANTFSFHFHICFGTLLCLSFQLHNSFFSNEYFFLIFKSNVRSLFDIKEGDYNFSHATCIIMMS